MQAFLRTVGASFTVSMHSLVSSRQLAASFAVTDGKLAVEVDGPQHFSGAGRCSAARHSPPQVLLPACPVDGKMGWVDTTTCSPISLAFTCMRSALQPFFVSASLSCPHAPPALPTRSQRAAHTAGLNLHAQRAAGLRGVESCVHPIQRLGAAGGAGAAAGGPLYSLLLSWFAGAFAVSSEQSWRGRSSSRWVAAAAAAAAAA